MLICLLCFVNLNGCDLSKDGVDECPAERDGKGYSVPFITSTNLLLQVGFIWLRVCAYNWASRIWIPFVSAENWSPQSAEASGNFISQASTDKCTLNAINYIDYIFLDYKVSPAWLFQKPSSTLYLLQGSTCYPCFLPLSEAGAWWHFYVDSFIVDSPSADKASSANWYQNYAFLTCL